MIMGEGTMLTLIRSIASGKLGKNRLSGIKQQEKELLERKCVSFASHRKLYGRCMDPRGS